MNGAYYRVEVQVACPTISICKKCFSGRIFPFQEEEPPKGFELYNSNNVRVERAEGMTLELDAATGDGGEERDVLVTSRATQKITEVVTITVEKTGDALDVAFLTPDVIERANALVVTHGPPQQLAAGEGTEIAIQDIKALFEE